MKCLSLRPGWAWAVIFGGKTVENRSWKTNYRGPLVIHASSSRAELHDIVERAQKLSGKKVPDEIDFGAVIGVVDLVECLPPDTPLKKPDAKWAAPGCYHWLFRNPRPCEPVDIKGKLMLWDLPSEKIKLR
jgi:hypothetical protein